MILRPKFLDLAEILRSCELLCVRVGEGCVRLSTLDQHISSLWPKPFPLSLSLSPSHRRFPTAQPLSRRGRKKPSIGRLFLSLEIALPLSCFSPPETPCRHSSKRLPFQLRSAVIPKIPAATQPSLLISPLVALPQPQHPAAVPLSATAPSFSGSSDHPNRATRFAPPSPAPDLRRPPPPLNYSNTLDAKRCFRTCLGVLPPTLQARIFPRGRPPSCTSPLSLERPASEPTHTEAF